MIAKLQSSALLLLLLVAPAAATVEALGDAGHVLIQLDVPDHAPDESTFTVSLTAQGSGALNASLQDLRGCQLLATTTTKVNGHFSGAWTLQSRHDPCRLLFAVHSGNETTYVPAVVTLGSWDEQISFWLPYLLLLGALIWSMMSKNWGLMLISILGIVGNTLPAGLWPFDRIATILYATLFFVSWYLIQGARLRLKKRREARAKAAAGESD